MVNTSQLEVLEKPSGSQEQIEIIQKTTTLAKYEAKQIGRKSQTPNLDPVSACMICIRGRRTMARKSSRVRWLVVLLVLVPIFTLVVLLSVEWSFVEVLQSQSNANQQQRDTPGKDAQPEEKIRAPRQRSPLANDNNKGEDYSQSMKDAMNVRNPTAPKTKVVFRNEGTPAISEGMPDLHLLKRRKKMEMRLENGLRELWWYLRAKLDSLKNDKAADGILTEVQEQFDLLNLHLKEMKSVSNSSKPFQPDWIYWQKILSKRTETLLQKRLEYLQNPTDCRWSRQLACNVAKGCGFGCQMHHVAYCFIMAYATERTLILDSSNWRYCRTNGWGCVFKPISQNCTRKFGKSEIPSCGMSMVACKMKSSMVLFPALSRLKF